MVAINRLARALVLVALVWSLGSLVAAVNWHGLWLEQQRDGPGSELALHAQERWQHWVDMTLVGVVVTVLALVGALWPLVRAAGERAQRPTGAQLSDRDGVVDLRDAGSPGDRSGFGGGSEEVRRHAEGRDAR